MMDISETLEPASDQLDAIELVSGPRIFEVERVTRGSAEQPVNVFLVDFPRPWRPGKSMRRVLAACWGNDASQWVGHKVELFFDPDVTFGKDRPGGTRIKRMSHIDEPRKVPLLVSRGKSSTYTVEVLEEQSPPPAFDIATCDSIPTLRKQWKTANADGKKAIEARVKQLEAEALGEQSDGGGE